MGQAEFDMLKKMVADLSHKVLACFQAPLP